MKFFMIKIGFVSLQFTSCKIDILLWLIFGYATATHYVRVGSCYSNNQQGLSILLVLTLVMVISAYPAHFPS